MAKPKSVLSEKKKQKLIEDVVKRLKQDLVFGDVTAIEELLSFCPEENLLQFLPERKWKDYPEIKTGS